jgi:hypothetical protein
MKKIVLAVILFSLIIGSNIGCSQKQRYTISMADGLQIKINQMVTGKDALMILKSFPGNNLEIPKNEEFLLMKLTFTNKSSQIVNVPYLYFLQVNTKTVEPKTLQIYFKDEFEMPEEGKWKKVTRLERIPPSESREGTICFVVPDNIIYKRFYVYQTYLTFPDQFAPSDIK